MSCYKVNALVLTTQDKNEDFVTDVRSCCCRRSVPKSCPTPCGPVDCSMAGSSALHPVPWFAQTHAHLACDAIQPAHPLRSPSSFAFNFPSIRVFSNKLAFHIRWLQHQSFQWIFRLISFRIDCFHLLAVQRTLKSLLQHHNLTVSIIWRSAFFMVQLSHQHVTTGKAILRLYERLLAKWYLCL